MVSATGDKSSVGSKTRREKAESGLSPLSSVWQEKVAEGPAGLRRTELHLRSCFLSALSEGPVISKGTCCHWEDGRTKTRENDTTHKENYRAHRRTPGSLHRLGPGRCAFTEGQGRGGPGATTRAPTQSLGLASQSLRLEKLHQRIATVLCDSPIRGKHRQVTFSISTTA